MRRELDGAGATADGHPQTLIRCGRHSGAPQRHRHDRRIVIPLLKLHVDHGSFRRPSTVNSVAEGHLTAVGVDLEDRVDSVPLWATTPSWSMPDRAPTPSHRQLPISCVCSSQQFARNQRGCSSTGPFQDLLGVAFGVGPDLACANVGNSCALVHKAMAGPGFWHGLVRKPFDSPHALAAQLG